MILSLLSIGCYLKKNMHNNPYNVLTDKKVSMLKNQGKINNIEIKVLKNTNLKKP